MRDVVRVATAALPASPDDTSGNLDAIAGAARDAADAGADILLCPELSITGFIPNHPTGDHATWLREALLGARRMAEPLDGRAVGRLTAIARDAHILVAAGLLEDAGAVLFNTHVLAGPDGVLGWWRKMHVPLFEMPFYNGGGAPAVVETPLGRIGVTVCIDAFLPESVRLLAIEGAEIVLFPFAADPAPVSPAGWCAWASPVVRARCVENGVFGVAANVRGDVRFAGVSQRFGGGALIVGPDGLVITSQEQEDGPALLVADLTREAQLDARAAFEYTFRFRRPELYERLARR
ncbi:MAG: carbon-nitrogen hydrolase family protein [Acidobacteria bacterium]|nr:carbon-nitrogen hydrolase family protein [Acidobacteriota bacterium]